MLINTISCYAFWEKEVELSSYVQAGGGANFTPIVKVAQVTCKKFYFISLLLLHVLL